MARPPLEAQLAALTQEFVTRLVEAIRNASFADVAGLSAPAVLGAPGRGAQRKPAGLPRSDASRLENAERKAGRPSGETRLRQTAAYRAELADRVVDALKDAPRPLGVRALSSELGVAPDLLAAPLRELRAAGRITKHGEKRATTYSAA